MRQALSRRWVQVVLVAVALCVLVVGGLGVYLLGVAGELPWQVDPTRIPITPFADTPGFDPPEVIMATPTGP